MIRIADCPFYGSRVWIGKGEFANITHFICSNDDCHAVVTIESSDWIRATEKFNKRINNMEDSK